MKFLKTFNETVKIPDGYWDNYKKQHPPVEKNEPEVTGGDTKLKFAKSAKFEGPKPPSFVKDPASWAADELTKLLQTAHNTEYGNSGNVKFGSLTNTTVFANAYSSCFSSSGPNDIREVKEKLEQFLKELKSKNLVRIKDAARILFANIGSKVSDVNVSKWMGGKDKYSFGMDVVKFEQLCSYLLN